MAQHDFLSRLSGLAPFLAMATGGLQGTPGYLVTPGGSQVIPAQQGQGAQLGQLMLLMREFHQEQTREKEEKEQRAGVAEAARNYLTGPAPQNLAAAALTPVGQGGGLLARPQRQQANTLAGMINTEQQAQFAQQQQFGNLVGGAIEADISLPAVLTREPPTSPEEDAYRAGLIKQAQVAATPEDPLSTDRIRASVLERMLAGGDLPPGIKSILPLLFPGSKGTTVTLADGTRIDFEGGANTIEERIALERALMDFKQEEPAPPYVLRLLGFPAETTIGELREQNISVPSEDVLNEFAGQQAAVEQFDTLAERMIETISGKPEILKAPGTLIRFTNEMRAAGEAIANVLGVDLEVTLDVAAFTDESGNTIRELAGLSAEAQSMKIALAFLDAIVEFGQTGRGLSDRDVERAIKRIGDSGDPDIVERVLRNVQVAIRETFNNRVKFRFGRAPIAATKLEDLTPADLGKLSDAELRALVP